MKPKPLADYFSLLRRHLERKDYVRAKRTAEAALSNLAILSYSPSEEYSLYVRLAVVYYNLAEYSRAIDILYKAYLLVLRSDSGVPPQAGKNNFGPAYHAEVAFLMGNNFIAMKNFNLALSQLQKVDEYYHKYGAGTSPMDEPRYVSALINIAYAYLCKNELDKSKDILYEKLPRYPSVLERPNYFIDYHHIRGEYLMALKEYKDAADEFDTCIEASRAHKFPVGIVEARMHLAEIDIIHNRLDNAVKTLEDIFKESYRLKLNYHISETGLLLSKCYGLNNLTAKSAAVQERIKPFLYKLDVGWLYETIRSFERLYGQMDKPVPFREARPTGVPDVLTRAIKDRESAQKASYRDFIIGKSEAMQEVFNLLDKVAATALPVLIQGKTGTGKELIAQTVHYGGPRRDKPYLTLNCGTIPESLAESMLFGHRQGSFTGAIADKKGYIELASDGTLFIDEVADMSVKLQQKLLRVLEEKQVWPVGAQAAVPVNTRFVFATNQPLKELVAKDRFRQDLYYRINVIVVNLPPLTERKDDIPLLLNHFIAKYTPAGLNPQSAIRISQSAMDMFLYYGWPGNIRELDNEVRRILLVHKLPAVITKEMVAEQIRDWRPEFKPPKDNLTYVQMRTEWERQTIANALVKCGGKIKVAAVYLKYPRSALYNRIKELGITKPQITQIKTTDGHGENKQGF